jgi:hypothetical protein
MNNSTMDTFVLVIGGLMLAAIVVQIWRGATFANINPGTFAPSVYRKTQPTRFWMLIGVQVLVLVAVIVVFKFVAV